jgi:hypothetical protein
MDNPNVGERETKKGMNMTVKFENIEDQERWEKARANVGEILELEPEKVLNYLVLAYDGTPEMKADTDMPEVEEVVELVSIFLRHVTGKKVRFED